MDFLKLHWRKFAFGAVCAAALAVGGMGVMSGDEIRRQMGVAEQVMTNLKKYSAGGANLEMIRAKKDETNKARTEYEAAIKAGRDVQVYNAFYEETLPDGNVKRHPRALVLEGVLPKLTRRSLAFNFKDAYLAEHAKLFERLRAKGPPSAEEVRAKALEMQRQREARKDLSEEPWAPVDATGADESTIVAKDQPLTREEALRKMPEVVASLERAKSIYMYAEENSLARHPLIFQTDPPTVDQIWQAQVSLWIQEDVVTVLARVNEAEAARLTKAGRADKACVAYLPIKHLVRLSIAPRLGHGGGMNTQAADFAASFTNRKNTNAMFVVPLQLEVIMDDRAIPALLHELTRVNFYTPVGFSYERLPPDLTQRGYIYGPQPVVTLKLDFEGCFFREVFNKWIPDVLKPVLDDPEARERERSSGRG